jgi:hypothetical protein
MEQQDDPEARIRELERSLSDEARASEAGAQPYVEAGAQPYVDSTMASTPPPMPPSYTPTYTPTYPMMTGSTSSSFRSAYMVLAVFIVGMLIVAGGIAFFALRSFSNGVESFTSSPTNRPGTSGQGSFTDRPSSGPNDSSSETPTTETDAVTPGGDLTVAGAFTKRTIACNDGNISVMGFSNTTVLTGHCASLTVSGSQNVVTVDNADTISASGLSNKVTYHSGSPQIDKSGSSNTVEQG